tara:strand:- start:56 stop:706 length:651 start_codon:yes stop_codon:yes gene_type:complete
MVGDAIPMYDCIVEYENACPDELCDQFIRLWVTPKENDMLEFHEGDKKVVECKTSQDSLLDCRNQEHMAMNDRYHHMLQSVKNKYADILLEKNLDKHAYDGGPYLFRNTIRNSTQTDVIIQKSEVGQYYHWHYDYSPARLLTCILYLNDMEDDAGGCTEFTCGRIVKPTKGKVLIFPATINYIHRGTIVKKGSKYIITTFSFINKRPPLPFKISYN